MTDQEARDPLEIRGDGRVIRRRPDESGAQDERTRIEQSNEVAGIVFDQVKLAWPDLHPVLDLRYGIADALWAAGYRKHPEPSELEAQERVLDAIFGVKHPEPEWEYGATYVDPGRPVSIRDTLAGARAAQELYTQIIPGLSSGQTYPPSNVYRRTKAVPAGPWQPVAEGE